MTTSAPFIELPDVPIRTGRPKAKQTVLVVDDNEKLAGLFSRLLTDAGYSVELAHDGLSGLKMAAQLLPDVVLLDLMLPEVDGFEVCRRLKREYATRLTPVILVTSLAAREDRIQGLSAGADDFLNKPVDHEELLVRVRSASRVKQFTDDLDSAASIIMIMAVMMEGRDGHSEGHCHRLANYATALGRSLDLGADDLQALHRGGFLHDIGMLSVPDPILRKVGPLEPEEFECVKSHTVVGDSLCANLRSLQAVRPIVRHHHERLDGSGYPDGLAGDDVPLLAQIMSIVDAYDALTTKRPYQDADSVDRALHILADEVARGWRRADLVEGFVDLVKSGRIRSPAR